jgi:two-component system torCAD operon response regulator TorR
MGCADLLNTVKTLPMPTHASHVLVVEDDEVTRAKLAGYLEAAGHRVSEAADGADMREAFAAEQIDLVLLDINLPGEDGLDLTRDIRRRSDVGIILVTGRTDDVDRIVGLEIGADDYVTKPFNPRELLARVKTLLRRTMGTARVDAVHKTFAGWTFDTRTRRLVSPQGERLSLTRAEYELLSTLVEHPGMVLGRERLLSHITHRTWDPSDRTIDVLVRRLRQKIEPDPKLPEFIITAHGEGYIFAAEVSER